MEKIEIKLKECCLTCEHIEPSGIYGLRLHENREIGCQHMPVCYKYRECSKAAKIEKEGKSDI